MLFRSRRKPKLPPDEDDEDFVITALVRRDGNIKRVEVIATGTIGLCLRTVEFDGSGELLLTENQVTNRNHFWRLWKHFNRDTILEWEE